MRILTALLICLPLAAQAYRNLPYIPLPDAPTMDKKLLHTWLERCMDDPTAAGDENSQPPPSGHTKPATCKEIFAEEERRLKYCGTTGMCKHYHYMPVPTDFKTFQQAGFEYLYWWAQACFDDEQRLPLCPAIKAEYRERSNRCLQLHNTPWCEAR